MHVIYPATTLDVSITYPSPTYPNPTYTTGTATEQAEGNAFHTSKVLLALPDWSKGNGRRGILAFHGGNQTAYGSFSGADTSRWGDYTRALVDAGYVICAWDRGTDSMSNNLAIRSADLAYNYLVGITGDPRVHIIGSSGGGNAALNWGHRNPDKVRSMWLFSTFLDLDVLYGTPGYTPAYSIQPGDPNADIVYPAVGDPTRVAEINASYKINVPSDYTANVIIQGHVPMRNPHLWKGMKIRFAHATRDAGVPYQMTQHFAKMVEDPGVTFRLVTGSNAAHNPVSHLVGGANDTETIAGGGVARAEIIDYFAGTPG